jgi:hypothetical protein
MTDTGEVAAARPPVLPALDPSQILGLLMDAIAAGKGREGEDGRRETDRWICRLSAGSQASYHKWLEFYEQHFPDRRYPRAQALLNTPEVMRALPLQYLYGTSLLLTYNPLEVRLAHLLDSSRFLYFQTQKEWSRAQRQAFRDKVKREEAISWKGKRTEADISRELRQLQAKYRDFLDGGAARPTEGPDREEVTIGTSASLREFIDRWLEAIGQQAAEQTGSFADAAFVDFSLLDLFDLAYLLKLHGKVRELRDFVKSSSDAGPERGTFCTVLEPGSGGYELLCPPWAGDGLVQRIVTFPAACQGFGERQSGTDDVLFVGFLHGTGEQTGAAAPGEGVSRGGHDRTAELSGLDQLRALVSLITSTSLNEWRRIEVLHEARHSAVSAIMGRNLSHNIGSHVLHWLARGYETLLTSAPDQDDGSDGDAMPRMQEMLRRSVPFLRYMQERMDYIATVTRSPAWWSYSSPLSALVGPLSTDRPSKEPVPDLVLLLENIGRSDGVLEINVSTAGHWDDFTRLNIALPHGAVGRQAFFTIIENIARNCAKHQPEGKDRSLKVAAESDERYPNLVKIVVDDGVTKAAGIGFRGMKRALRAGICDRRGRPVMRQLGFKEMRICAAFLRTIDPAGADDLHEPDLLAIEKRDGRANLVFYLLKASDLLFVTADAREARQEWKTLDDLGIGVMPPGDEVKQALLRYRFIVFLDDGASEEETRNWVETTFGTAELQRPLPVRSLRVDSLPGPEHPEGCRIGAEQARDLRRRIEEVAGAKEGVIEAAARLKESIYDLWLQHNFPGRERVQITVFGAGHSWVADYEGTAATGKNPFDQNAEGRITMDDLAASFPAGARFDPTAYTAVFAHHGLLPRLRSVREDPRVIFAQGWSGSSATGSFLEQVPEPSAGPFLIRELREAALSRVLIIDERLAPADPLLREERFQAGIVLIGQEFVDLVKGSGDERDTGEQTLRIEWPEEVEAVQADGQFQFASIHYGLIEKGARTLEREVEPCVKAIVDHIRKIAAVVLVHSGRGRPDLPAGVRYLDFSSLEALLNEDKRTLVIGLGGI